MQRETMGNRTPLTPLQKPPQLRGKVNSLKDSSPLLPPSCKSVEFATLSSSADLSRQKRLSLEELVDYLEDVLKKVYPDDAIGFRQTLSGFLTGRMGEFRGKVHERLSLMKYLQGSLKYRSFVEIQAQVVREWRKNALLFSIGTIWGRNMLAHQFKNQQQFSRQYERFRTLLANLTQFYFRSCLKVLAAKGVDTLTLLFDDTTHQIIGGLGDWKEVYNVVLLPLLGGGGGKVTCPEDEEGKDSPSRFHFDLARLRVNQQYLNPTIQDNQLPLTTQLIVELASQHRIHQKAALLKKIRTAFLSEVTESNRRIQAQLGFTTSSQFEKDDIIDCMIYCIVKGGITGLGCSLKTMALLLGRDSELLAKKGVDSYRADLQGAIQYLSEDAVQGSMKENARTTVLASHC